MKKNKTLTIGIPAYNEEANIAVLIAKILNQKERDFNIKKIIISSDGSTDKTVEAAKSLKSSVVDVLNNKERKGIARGLNQIIKGCNSDILVTLDADIDVSDPEFLYKLINPIIKSGADLTSSAIAATQPSTFYGKVIFVSTLLKNILFEIFKKGHNIYTCHGLARGYSHRLYKNLTFPTSVGNDMYSYLKCASENFDYRYAPTAVAWYKLPENYKDHKHQSTRFFNSFAKQKKFFDPQMVNKETKIPLRDYIAAFSKSGDVILKYPAESAAYLLLQIYMRFRSLLSGSEDVWSIAVSTKNYE